uniref:Collagen alpha-1(I) chain-like n=1 Tax=Castor canadensis TaxID=51338 RepID=A0A8B7TWB3_CASCN|nr:collagen alpha-1(I) chain-like [Castor canadensis]
MGRRRHWGGRAIRCPEVYLEPPEPPGARNAPAGPGRDYRGLVLNLIITHPREGGQRVGNPERRDDGRGPGPDGEVWSRPAERPRAGAGGGRRRRRRDGRVRRSATRPATPASVRRSVVRLPPPGGRARSAGTHPGTRGRGARRAQGGAERRAEGARRPADRGRRGARRRSTGRLATRGGEGGRGSGRKRGRNPPSSPRPFPNDPARARRARRHAAGDDDDCAGGGPGSAPTRPRTRARRDGRASPHSTHRRAGGGDGAPRLPRAPNAAPAGRGGAEDPGPPRVPTNGGRHATSGKASPRIGEAGRREKTRDGRHANVADANPRRGRRPSQGPRGRGTVTREVGRGTTASGSPAFRPVRDHARESHRQRPRGASRSAREPPPRDGPTRTPRRRRTHGDARRGRARVSQSRSLAPPRTRHRPSHGDRSPGAHGEDRRRRGRTGAPHGRGSGRGETRERTARGAPGKPGGIPPPPTGAVPHRPRRPEAGARRSPKSTPHGRSHSSREERTPASTSPVDGDSHARLAADVRHAGRTTARRPRSREPTRVRPFLRGTGPHRRGARREGRDGPPRAHAGAGTPPSAPTAGDTGRERAESPSAAARRSSGGGDGDGRVRGGAGTDRDVRHTTDPQHTPPPDTHAPAERDLGARSRAAPERAGHRAGPPRGTLPQLGGGRRGTHRIGTDAVGRLTFAQRERRRGRADAGGGGHLHHLLRKARPARIAREETLLTEGGPKPATAPSVRRGGIRPREWPGEGGLVYRKAHARHDRSTRPRAANRERRRAGVRPPQGPSRTRDTAVKKRQAAFAAARPLPHRLDPFSFSGRWPREARQRGRGKPRHSGDRSRDNRGTRERHHRSASGTSSRPGAPGAPRRATTHGTRLARPRRTRGTAGETRGPCPTAGGADPPPRHQGAEG